MNLLRGSFYPWLLLGCGLVTAAEQPVQRLNVIVLLADDMGLGKTVQVIALLSHMHEEQRLGPSLLVVPKTVIPNWQNEIEKFCSANLFIV